MSVMAQNNSSRIGSNANSERSRIEQAAILMLSIGEAAAATVMQNSAVRK